MKRFSDIELVMAHMQMHENDSLLLGINRPGDTIEDILNNIKKSIDDYIENNPDYIKKKAENGFIANFELYEKIN